MPALSTTQCSVSSFSLRRDRALTALGATCLCWASLQSCHAVEASFGSDALSRWQEEWQAENQAYAPSFELNTAILPNVGDALNSGGAYRGGMANGAASNFSNATQHLDLTRWLTPESPNRFGLTLGLSGPVNFLPAPANNSAGTSAGAAQPPMQLDLGVRWRSQLQRGRHLDVSAWAQTPDAMGLIWQTQPPTYGTRVEVQWASSRTRGLMPEFGAIGVQLQGGSRLVLRARKGGPMLYYRARF
ncbi:hypothetical protein [Acidovorax sp.]|uniref:hypothetical protein n=1 Tax=Acidovorax sp. TaxID=1872122 RepID=UPI00391B7549